MADTVLAIVAHPDDESFWMGGTLARFATEGKWVIVEAATTGTCGRRRGRDDQFAKACRALGAKGHRSLWFDDQRADAVDRLDINACVEMSVREHKPILVVTHYHGDLNIDHRRVAEAVLVATRGICPVWMCEPEWRGRVVGEWMKTNYLECLDASALKAKRAACRCYPEELRDPPHPRSRVLQETVERFVQIGQWD